VAMVVVITAIRIKEHCIYSMLHFSISFS